MTADNWEPSEKIREIAFKAYWTWDNWSDVIKAVRPLIIAEAKPGIEAAERERVAHFVETLPENDNSTIAQAIRALKDSKP